MPVASSNIINSHKFEILLSMVLKYRVITC